jgi:hypothetical protein
MNGSDSISGARHRLGLVAKAELRARASDFSIQRTATLSFLNDELGVRDTTA